MHFENSVALNRYVSEQHSGVCLLAFSCGKDSIAAWLELKKYFHTIIPAYRYLVPGLEFVEESLRYYEDYFETRIIRMPHVSLYRMLNEFVFQAPENLSTIERAGLASFAYEDIDRIIKEDLALDKNLLCANGVRMCDSPMRRISIKAHGPINFKKNSFCAVYDWNKADVMGAIESAGVKLPVDYALWGRSFDGIDYRFMKPLREHFPEDYERILEFFPLVELEMKLEYRAERRAA